MKFVVGLVLTPDLDRIVLMKKKRGPPDVRGRLNGPGGSILSEESPAVAMAREFNEEAGIFIPPRVWSQTVVLVKHDHDASFCIFFFVARLRNIDRVKTMTDEEVGVYPTSDLWKLDVVTNLRWIIPMSLDRSVRLPVEVLLSDSRVVVPG